MNKKRVAVIGAGPSGLVTIKCLKEEDIEPVCFEKTCFYGGLWQYHDDDVEGIASVMKTTIINTSKEITAFSDFPPDEDCPNYMRNTEVHKMLTTYIEKFDLLRHIKYNQEVSKVELNEDYNETGRIKVFTQDTRTGNISNDVFDGVVVCIGHHVYPSMPSFPGQQKFKGSIMHTHSLKTVQNFADKIVVVVGVGNSGMDASVEISNVSKQVYLSTRRGTWVCPRVGPTGVPFDMTLVTHFYALILKYMPLKFCSYLVELLLNRYFDHAKYNIKPAHPWFSQHPSISDTLPIKLLSGTVKVRPNVKEFQEDGVIFEGEDTVTHVDAVVFATGYSIKFSFLDDKILTVKNNKFRLYKYIYPPHLLHNTVGIVGLFQVLGSGFSIGEAQARLFCQVFNGKVKLPNAEEMEKDIEKKEKELAKRYVVSDRHTMQVDYVSFSDEINSMFGAKPNLLKMMITDPELFFLLFFGPSLPYQYRLQGPHSWDGARETILSYKKRLYKPLKKDYKFEEKGFQNVITTVFFLYFYIIFQIVTTTI